MGRTDLWILASFALAALVAPSHAKQNVTDSVIGSGKAFSIFNVVTFKNDGCRSKDTMTTGQSPFRNGTCYQASECSSKGGVASGNCASGFGVCCLFLLSTTGSAVTQNCTYIRNPGFPTALTTTTAISYTVNKVNNNICWLRLDFESMTIAGPAVTVETDGGACKDTFKIVSSANQVIPTICGVNTGQHIYVEMGTASTDNAQLSFTFDSTVTTVARSYEVKVSQIECSNLNRPPSGCLQYWSTIVGRITTFNFGGAILNHLASQDVTACIRRNVGYCCVQYQVCEGVPNAFSLDSSMIMANAATMAGNIDTLCAGDYVSIPASSTLCTFNSNNVFSKYCGYSLGFGEVVANQPVCDCTYPFRVAFHTDAAADAKSADNPNRGVCLDFTQIPCQTN